MFHLSSWKLTQLLQPKNGCSLSFWGQPVKVIPFRNEQNNLLSVSSIFLKTYTWNSTTWRMICIDFGKSMSQVDIMKTVSVPWVAFCNTYCFRFTNGLQPYERWSLLILELNPQTITCFLHHSPAWKLTSRIQMHEGWFPSILGPNCKMWRLLWFDTTELSLHHCVFSMNCFHEINMY